MMARATRRDVIEIVGFVTMITAIVLNVILWGVIWQVTL